MIDMLHATEADAHAIESLSETELFAAKRVGNKTNNS